MHTYYVNEFAHNQWQDRQQPENEPNKLHKQFRGDQARHITIQYTLYRIYQTDHKNLKQYIQRVNRTELLVCEQGPQSMDLNFQDVMTSPSEINLDVSVQKLEVMPKVYKINLKQKN